MSPKAHCYIMIASVFSIWKDQIPDSLLYSWLITSTSPFHMKYFTLEENFCWSNGSITICQIIDFYVRTPMKNIF